MVSRIVIENGRAVGVEFKHKGQVTVVRANKEVLLSAGAFQSPQVLMLSGIGPRQELEKHGIECAMLPMRHSRTLGGTFHCVTLDLERKTDV